MRRLNEIVPLTCACEFVTGAFRAPRNRLRSYLRHVAWSTDSPYSHRCQLSMTVKRACRSCIYCQISDILVHSFLKCGKLRSSLCCAKRSQIIGACNMKYVSVAHALMYGPCFPRGPILVYALCNEALSVRRPVISSAIYRFQTFTMMRAPKQ
jgi:hypothetical protein